MSNALATAPRRNRSFHPMAEIFPLMVGAELADLVKDIAAHGLHMPIVLDQAGAIVDGRNRYRALQQLGWDGEESYYEVTNKTGADLVEYVVSLNLHRRHLDDNQRAMVAAKLANLHEGRPKTTPIGVVLFDEPPNVAVPPVSQSMAADLLNVSHRAVQRAAKVHKGGSPALVAAVEQGHVAVSTAAELATLAVEDQEAIMAQDDVDLAAAAKGLQEQRKAAREAEPQADALPFPDHAAQVTEREAREAQWQQGCDEAMTCLSVLMSLQDLTEEVGIEVVDAEVLTPWTDYWHPEATDLSSRLARAEGWLSHLMGQVNRLASLVDLPPLVEWSPRSPDLSLVSGGVAPIIDAVVALLTPVVTEAPTYDATKYHLGSLCKRGHEYGATGQSLRVIKSGTCYECQKSATNKYYHKRQAQRAPGEEGNEAHTDTCATEEISHD